MITCTAYGPAGPAVYLATSTDFRSVERHGIVVTPEDKNAALLPERVGGKWILFHRPTSHFGRLALGHLALALRRSAQLEPAGGGAGAPRRRLVGLAAGSGSARRCSRPSTAGCSSTTASRRRSRARSTGSGSRCSTWRSRRASSAGRRLGARADRAI